RPTSAPRSTASSTSCPERRPALTRRCYLRSEAKRRAWEPAMAMRLRLLGVLAAAWIAIGLMPTATHAAPPCGPGRASKASVGSPTTALAWRAAPIGRPQFYRRIPVARGRRSGRIHPRSADWLLVLRAARDRHGRCWARVRLPDRPNDAAG